METKECTKCHQELPVSEFTSCKHTRSGLQSWCKGCVRTHQRERYKSDPELRKRTLVRTAEYAKSHPEIIKKSQANYLAKNREKRAENTNRYFRENPEKRTEHAARFRARQHGVEVGKVDYKAIWERDRGVCHICGEPVPEDEKGFDHVVPMVSGGSHTMDNIKVAHRSCNSIKFTTLMDDFDLSKLINRPVSGYIGVIWNGASWVASINVKGQRIYLGAFLSPEEAAMTWDEAAIKYRGKSTRTNFPKSVNVSRPKKTRRTRNTKTWQEKVRDAIEQMPERLPAGIQLEPSGKHRTIPLTQGMYTVVDEADYERVSQYNWNATKHGSNWYASRTVHGGKRKKVFLHRFIMDAPDDMYVDHLNGDGLINTRENLRLCTPSENNYNRQKTSINTSGHKGVYLNKSTGRWVARIGVRGTYIHLGTFDSRQEAASVYDEAAQLCHGEFAYTNELRETDVPKPVSDLSDVDGKRLYIANTTGYRGVCLKTGATDLWIAQIRVDGNSIHLGIYDSPEKAARVWDAAARKYRGRDTYTNFPDGSDDDELLSPNNNPYHNKHGFMGVSQTNKGKWMANIQINRERTYLGLYDTPEAAARAWDAAAIKHRGMGTRTNFPQSDKDEEG